LFYPPPEGLSVLGGTCFSLEKKPGAIFTKWLLAMVPAEQIDFKTEKVFLYIPAFTAKSA
jgi:hypothetical protein